VFKDQSAGLLSIYNSEHRCNGEDAWVFWQASNGPLTPDLKDGLNYYIVLNADLTINPLVHRGGVAGGRRVRFTFDPGGSGARHVVTWDPSYNDAPQPITSVGRRTTVEFIQEDLTFTGVSLRRVDMTQPVAGYQFVKRTSGSYVF